MEKRGTLSTSSLQVSLKLSTNSLLESAKSSKTSCVNFSLNKISTENNLLKRQLSENAESPKNFSKYHKIEAKNDVLSSNLGTELLKSRSFVSSGLGSSVRTEFSITSKLSSASILSNEKFQQKSATSSLNLNNQATLELKNFQEGKTKSDTSRETVNFPTYENLLTKDENLPLQSGKRQFSGPMRNRDKTKNDLKKVKIGLISL